MEFDFLPTKKEDISPVVLRLSAHEIINTSRLDDVSRACSELYSWIYTPSKESFARILSMTIEEQASYADFAAKVLNFVVPDYFLISFGQLYAKSDSLVHLIPQHIANIAYVIFLAREQHNEELEKMYMLIYNKLSDKIKF